MPITDDMTIDACAAAWVAREDRGPLDEAATLERDRWLAADPRHLGAYARARAVFVRTGRAAALANGLAGGGGGRRPRARGWLRGIGWGAGIAAGLALVAVGLHGAFQGGDTYATRKGEVLRVPLQDGSAITLNSATEVEVDYDRTRRGIRLLHGEAIFDVARNRDVPFVVEAGGTSVTAVGTSFSVRLDRPRDEQVLVLVREGIVDVAETASTTAPARVLANSQVVAHRGKGIRVERLPEDGLAQKLAWREGMLSFNGDTLGSAAEQFLRYSDLRIVIDDPGVRERRIVGLYSASDPAGFARSVALSLGLVAERRGNVVHLRAAAPQPNMARQGEPTGPDASARRQE